MTIKSNDLRRAATCKGVKGAEKGAPLKFLNRPKECDERRNGERSNGLRDKNDCKELENIGNRNGCLFDIDGIETVNLVQYILGHSLRLLKQSAIMRIEVKRIISTLMMLVDNNNDYNNYNDNEMKYAFRPTAGSGLLSSVLSLSVNVA